MTLYGKIRELFHKRDGDISLDVGEALDLQPRPDAQTRDLVPLGLPLYSTEEDQAASSDP